MKTHETEKRRGARCLRPERNETRSTACTSFRKSTTRCVSSGGMHLLLTCDGRVAAGALFSIHVTETLDAVRTLPLRGEGLAS